MKPILDNLIIEPEEASSVLKTEGHATTAIVKWVGPGEVGFDALRAPMEVAVGDRILFDPQAVAEVHLKGEILHYIKMRNVIAVL